MGRGKTLCWWTVAAGFAQGETAERFARSFVVTYGDWSGGDVPGRRLRAARQQEAVSYASKLMADELLTWVTLEYGFNDPHSTDDAA